MPSIGRQLQLHGGIGPGFDAARVALALAILCWHSVMTSYGLEAELAVWASPYSAPLSALMPMFFALSGFLVMGSFERTRDLKTFLGLRALRILPALTTEILISAFVLGSLLTTRPLASYFTDPLFFKYFGSLVGKVSVALPGVFETNPRPGLVNVSLWTIAPELTCYMYLGLQVALRLRRFGVTVAACALILANVAADVGGAPTSGADGVVLSRFLVLSFALGNLLYVWRDRIPFRWDLAGLCAGAGLLLVRDPHLVYLALAGFAYLIVFVGCCRVPLPYPFSTGDYSYGIYLYAFPIQQTFAQFFPAHRQAFWSILACVPVVCCIAFASWWLVEKPALRFRKFLRGSKPASDVPSAPSMAFAATTLTAYGFLLALSSGFFAAGFAKTGAFAVAVPAAIGSAAIVALLRARFLRTRSVPGIVFATASQDATRA